MRSLKSYRFLSILLLPLVAASCGGSGDNTEQAASAQEAFVTSVKGTPPKATETGPAPDPGAAPRIELQTDKWDMGLVENDRIAEQRMKVANRGTAPLKISKVTTSCGCTTGEMAESVIEPGGEADLIIRVNPAKIPGFSAEKVLTIFNNDPANSQPTVHVLTHVKPEADFDPEVLDFGTIAVGDGAELTTTMRQKQEPELEVSAATMGRDLPFIEVTYELLPEAQWTVPGKREYKITAKLSKDAPVGVYDEWLWVSTNIKRYANLPVKFKGEVKGPYTISPRNVAIRSVTPGQPVAGVLTIASEKSLKITEVTNTNSAVELTHREGGAPNSFVFDLNVPKRTPSRALRDVWTITLDVDGKTLVETVPATIILSSAN